MSSLTKLLIGLATADFLAAVDSTAVSVAMPTIAETFNLTPTGVSWIQTAYTLALVLILIPSGKIGDIHGHKRNFFVGLLLFGISSFAIIFAPNFTLLVLFRVLQGAAGAILYTASGALIAAHWRKTEFAFGITAAFFSLGMLFGPIVGGMLTDLNIAGVAGWHWIFAINLPFAALSGWLVSQTANETTQLGQKLKFDLSGFGLLAIALVSLVMALMQNEQRLTLFGVAAISLLAMIWFESKSKRPLLQLQVFTRRTFAAISLFTLAAMFSLIALSFVNTFYLQEVLGYSATKAGLMLIPIFLGMGIFSVVAGFFQNWKLGTVTASLLILAGMIVLSRVNPSVAYFQGLFWGYLLVSAGGGFMMTNTFAAALGTVDQKDSGLAAGYINTVQQIGALAGIAFVAGQDVIKGYQNIYYSLIVVAWFALVAALFVRNKR